MVICEQTGLSFSLCIAFPSSISFSTSNHFYMSYSSLLTHISPQLLGQLESSGPPPAAKDMISSLPTFCISQEETGSNGNITDHTLHYTLRPSIKSV